MKVKATALGFLYNRRYREGDVFELKTIANVDKKGVRTVVKPEEQFSDVWMEEVGARAKITAEPVSHEDAEEAHEETEPAPKTAKKKSKKKARKQVASVI